MFKRGLGYLSHGAWSFNGKLHSTTDHFLSHLMKFADIFRRMRNGIFIVIALALVAGYAVHESEGSSGGILGYSRSGCSCHGSRSTATVVSIYTDSSQIVAGKTYVFSLSVANPSEKAAGCDMTVSSGSILDTIGSTSGLQLYNNELTHTTPRIFAGDSAVWTFKYTAPKTAGTAHIYVAGNAVNLDGSADAADHWNTLVYNITVVSSGVERSDDVSSNVSISPNPSHGVITLSSQELSGASDIEVADPSGRIVHSETVIMGTETPLDLSGLQNGPYFLTGRTREGKSFTRSIIIDK